MVGVIALVSACASIVGIDGLEIGECKGGGPCTPAIAEAGSDGATDAPTQELDAMVDGSLPCPSGRGPEMIRVGPPENRFCIDTTEVTVGQYKAFLADPAADAGAQPPECAWNTTYLPGLSGVDDVPQTGVDWCDARRFCEWSGKRLCGKFVGGKAMGPLSEAELGNIDVHAWFIACTAQGQLRYPYGSIIRPGACNLSDADAGKALPVKSMPGCVGGYPGLYDMVGNVWEWFDGPVFPQDAGAGITDAGDGGPAKQQILAKGGAFTTPGTIDCRGDGRGGTRDLRAADIGFRCCSE